MSKLKHILPGEPIPRGSLFHERRYRVALSALGDLKSGGLLLDIGCGDGSQTEFLAKHFGYCIGIDLQHSRLSGFRKELLSRRVGNIILLGGNAEILPFKDASFDYVTCFEILEHVEEQETALQEVRRILKPGGFFAISVPHRWWIFETHGANLPLVPWNRVPFFSWLPKSIHDRWARARNYTQNEMRRILANAGFVSIQTQLLTAPMDVVKNKKMQQILRTLVFKGDTTKNPLLSSNIFVCAKKNA